MQTKEINSIVGKLLPNDADDVAKIAEDLGYENLPIRNVDGYTLARGISTKDTPGGYTGRAGLYETIDVDEDIQKMIVNHSTAAEIMRLAREKGTVTMRQDGILKVLTGVTSIEEVDRVASDLA